MTGCLTKPYAPCNLLTLTFTIIIIITYSRWHIRMKPDMILQMLSNAEFLFTDETLVWSLPIVDVHVICEFCFAKEFQGADFAVKQCNALLSDVLFHVKLVTFSFCKCFEAVVASVKGSVCFHWLHIVHSSVLP